MNPEENLLDPPSGVVTLGKLIRLHDGPRPRRGAQGVEYYRSCPDCGGKHWIPRNAPTDRCPDCLVVWRQQLDRQRRQEVIASAVASIPEKYRWAQLDAHELPERIACPEVMSEVRAALAAKVVLLVGGTGRGKTSLGTAIFRAHLERATAEGAGVEARAWGAKAFWVGAKPLSTNRRETPLGEVPALISGARGASVLLVDDLGQEAPSDKDDVVAVLENQYDKGFPLIVTCGWGVAGMKERYSPHLIRRLVAGAEVIDLGGDP